MKSTLRSSSPLFRSSLAILGVVSLMPAPTFAADQMILGSKFSVQDGVTQDKRKLSFSAKEKGSPNTLVGDPVTNGATLNIRMTNGSANGDNYSLPAGTSTMTGKPFWSGDAVKGFKYQDSKGENGPIAKAQISAKKGTFQIKLSMSGKYALISTLPPNPGADACALLTLTGGDSYSVNFASGLQSDKGAKSFKIQKPLYEGTCARPNPNNMPIEHVVVLMQENRSADTYLAQLSTSGQPNYEAEPNTGNPDPTNPLNPPILPFHKTTYCEVQDLDHSWKGTHQEVNSGAMNGFTTKNATGLDPTGSRAMGYYDQTDLPYYFGLYTTFATGDRYFCSTQTQTYPNRMYLLAGTSFGYIRNDFHDLPYAAGGTYGVSNFPSVFNLLDAGGVTWRIYSGDYPISYGSVFFDYVAQRAAGRVFPLSQYTADLAAGKLPDVVFIDPSATGGAKVENDEHPIANVQVGQKFVADTLNPLLASSAWGTSAIFFTYDEHGGFYDHVPPPAAVPPDAIHPKWVGSDPHEEFDEYGIRVPMVVISPYSKSNYVSHTVYDHTSILKFIETRFGMPSLTARDAAADPMLDLFDFNTATFAVPPSLPAAVVDPVKLAACPG